MWRRLKNFDPIRLAVAAVCLCASVCALASLSWKIVQDAPVMLYQAHLMTVHGQMPYRDFFCINMPGALWAYAGMIRVFGLSDMALHLANLLIVAGIAVLNGLVFPCGQRLTGGLLAAGMGVMRVYSGESFFILQRELLALFPLSAIAYVGLRRPLRGFGNEAALGFFVACLGLIKPQFVLFGLPVLVLLVMDGETWAGRLRAAMAAGCAFAVPVVLCGVWLWQNGALPRFRETLAYWALYGQMTQDFAFVPSAERLRLVLRGEWALLRSPFMIAASGALWLAWRQRVLERREVVFWGSLLGVMLLALGLSGQFWGYHKLPFYFFTLMMACRFAVCRGAGRWLAAGMAAVWIPFTAVHVWRETAEPSVARLKQGVAAAFTQCIQGRLRPGETVLPMDWTYAALHAMLRVDALPATRFLEYSYFLHSVSHPLIRQFRGEFMEQLAARAPRFILEARAQDWPHGLDTEARFADFECWRDARYRIVDEAEAYRVWEWNAGEEAREDR